MCSKAFLVNTTYFGWAAPFEVPDEAYDNYAHPYFVITETSQLISILPSVVQYVISPTLKQVDATKTLYLPPVLMQFNDVSVGALSVTSSAAFFTRDVLWVGRNVASNIVSEGSPTSLVLDLANAQGAIGLGGSASALYIQVRQYVNMPLP